MVFCCASGCKSRGGKLKRGSQTFHRFPTDLPLRKRWVEAVARVGWTPNNSRLCSLHFKDDDYDGSAELRRWRLKSGAVPSVFERARPIRGISDPKVCEEVMQGLDEEVQGGQGEENKELGKTMLESRASGMSPDAKLRVISELDEECSHKTQVGLHNFDLSLENLQDDERNTAIRRKFHMMTKKVEKLEAELVVSRRENDRLRDRISFLSKDNAIGGGNVKVVRSTQTRVQDFARVNDGRLIEDSEDDAEEYHPPIHIQKRRRHNESPKKKSLQKPSENDSRMLIVPAILKEAKKSSVIPTSMPGYGDKWSSSPSFKEADFRVEDHVNSLDRSQKEEGSSPSFPIKFIDGRIISVIKAEKQESTNSAGPTTSATLQSGIRTTAAEGDILSSEEEEE